MNSPQNRIAGALAGNLPVMSEPGLESPPEMNLLKALAALGSGLNAGSLGASLAGALAAHAGPALQGLGEAGAVFPEGSPLPADPQSAREMLSILPDSQRAYRTNEALARWHASNEDFPTVLKDKWAMLKHAGGN